MSEHSRFQRDRSATRDQRSASRGHSDRIDSERRHREPHAANDRNHNAPHDNDAWHRHHTDRDATYHAGAHYEDRRFDRDRISPTFSRNPAERQAPDHATQHRAAMPYQPQQDTPPEQDVWLREKQSRITFNDYDLQDIEFTERSDRLKKLAAYGGVVAMIGLIVFLGFSSTPDLSPLEIIAAEGYQGEQPTKTPFNLASLRDCEPGTKCAEDLKSSVTPVAITTTATEPVTQPTIITQTSTATIANSIITTSDSIPFTDDSSSPAIQEIAAADINVSSTRLASINSDADLYDRLSVLQQWSNVRGTPDINGDILISLDIGKTVTKLGETGQWIEVQVDERPSVTGYMHRSTLAPQ